MIQTFSCTVSCLQGCHHDKKVVAVPLDARKTKIPDCFLSYFCVLNEKIRFSPGFPLVESSTRPSASDRVKHMCRRLPTTESYMFLCVEQSIFAKIQTRILILFCICLTHCKITVQTSRNFTPAVLCMVIRSK